MPKIISQFGRLADELQVVRKNKEMKAKNKQACGLRYHLMQYVSFILCVDEDEEDCNVLTESIHSYNPDIDVKFVSTGDLAVKCIKENPKTILLMIILDINSTGMNGKRTFLQMKEILGDNVYPNVLNNHVEGHRCRICST